MTTNSKELRSSPPNSCPVPNTASGEMSIPEGNVEGIYRFVPIMDDAGRERALTLSWAMLQDAIQDGARFQYSSDRTHCGPFSFELRAWDIAVEDTKEIAERFDFQRTQVRKTIRAHKGISVYRDGVLVLPKSDSARDWLGLDLRRISKVGTRLSTNQIVGYISITAEDNPEIKDTSDREGLVSRLGVAEFEEILKGVVALFENERDVDRIKRHREKPLHELFQQVSAEGLVEEVVNLAEGGALATETVPLVRAFGNSLDLTRKMIQQRFVYYSHLATVGTIANMLVHEIRNRTTAFGSFMDLIKDRFGPFRDKYIEEEFRMADRGISALERLADTFLPLASRSSRRRKLDSVLEDQIRECLTLHRTEITRKHVQCYVPDSETKVAVDPGELDAIVLNFDNERGLLDGRCSQRRQKTGVQSRPHKGWGACKGVRS